MKMYFDEHYENHKLFEALTSEQLDDYITEAERDHNFLANFDVFWADVCAFAEQNRLSSAYVEEEFILDGEFFPVQLKWEEDQ